MAAAVSTTTPTQANPNAPQSSQQAAVSGVVPPAPTPTPLGSPSTASTITPSPTDTSAASYYNQLNQASSPTPTPTPTPQPSATPAPSQGIISAARTQKALDPTAAAPAPGIAPPAPAPAPAPSAGIIGSARQQATPPAPSPAPAAISPLLTQPADYSKPESQAEIDAYNQLALQAGQTGNYAALDSIGANDERNIFGATFAPGDKENPAFINAQMSGQNTNGIQQWLTPQQVAAGISSLPATNPAPAAAQQSPSAAPIARMKAQAQATPANQAANAATINADFAKDFGRPAASTGLQFYEQMMADNPNMTPDQLNAAILNGAQSQDQLASASLNGTGAVANNWTNPLLNPANVESNTTNPTGNATWNAATGQWTVAPGANLTTTTNPNGAPTNASTYTPDMLGNPTQVNVNSPQTVAGELANIDNANSPIIQAARTQALQQANASGLLNSTMAITAGDTAAYNAALPVAEQDATTYNNDAVTNAAADNQFAVNNQNALNQAGQFNAGAQNTLNGQKMTEAMQAATTSQKAGDTYANWIWNIQNSTMDAGAKNTAEVQAYNAYLQQMQTLAAQGIPDVSGLLQFTGVDPNTGLPDYRDPTTGLYSSTSGAPGATPAPTPTPTPTPTNSGPTNNPHQ